MDFLSRSKGDDESRLVYQTSPPPRLFVEHEGVLGVECYDGGVNGKEKASQGDGRASICTRIYMNDDGNVGEPMLSRG